jgi:serine/threonine protein kinase
MSDHHHPQRRILDVDLEGRNTASGYRLTDEGIDETTLDEPLQGIEEKQTQQQAQQLQKYIQLREASAGTTELGYANNFQTAVLESGIPTSTHHQSDVTNSPTNISSAIASHATFVTARSSLASYITATSGSSPRWTMKAFRSGLLDIVLSKGSSATEQMPGAQDVTYGDWDDAALSRIVLELMQLADTMGIPSVQKRHFQKDIREILVPTDKNVKGNKAHGRAELIEKLVNMFAAHVFVGSRLSLGVPGPVFSSEWLQLLRKRRILLGPSEELDWSGKGQHVEYTPHEESNIPLISEKILGHGQSAIIDSVRCRRIKLARKTITCDRRLKKEQAIVEVEHLIRLPHSHVVRVVGTYTLRRNLVILLYPVADWDLDMFMDDLLDHFTTTTEEALRTMHPNVFALRLLRTFFGCLSNAIDFIHGHNIKHMDIKPKNLLVRRIVGAQYRIYVADFGIARAYQSKAESETDSPISFTRHYAAPEVAFQERRGLSADVFSLGCVFVEMMATFISLEFQVQDERERLLKLRKKRAGNPSFYANIELVQNWCKVIYNNHHHYSSLERNVQQILPRMIEPEPNLRPLAGELKAMTLELRCSRCDHGPEPFQAACNCRFGRCPINGH